MVVKPMNKQDSEAVSCKLDEAGQPASAETPTSPLAQPSFAARIRSVSWVTILVVAITIATLDQITKQIILANFYAGEVRPVIPGLFNLVLTYNPGAAFGIFGGIADGMRELVLVFTTLLALAAVFFFLVFDYYHDRFGQVALALVVGGAIGNVVDRFMHGAVVDFLDFYLGSYHWPAFNVADSAICIGVAIVLFRRSWR